MKKALKITGIVVGIFVLLVIVLALTLPFLINPNRFKDDIAAAVKQKTGRELVIQGDIKLSIFPWLGLQIGPMELSNAPGFGGAPFAAINETDVHVHFWPLLHRRVEVGEVKLDGLSLDLELDANGHSNWRDISERLAHSTVKSGAEEGAAGQALSMDGLSVTDSQVRWTNAEKHQQYSITDFTLTLGAFVPAQPVTMESAFDFTGTNPAVQGHADFNGMGVADFAHEIYSTDGAKLELQAKGDAVPGGSMDAVLQWQHEAVNLDSSTMAVNGLAATLYGLQLKMDVQGKDISKAPSYTGTLKIDRFTPRDVLNALGRTLFTNTRDPAALGSATVAFTFVTNPSSAALNSVDIVLDDTHLTGTAEIKDFKTDALGFDLTADKLDADRYLPPPQAGTPERPREAVDVDKIGIPLRTLRSLNVDGHLHMGQFTLLNAKASDLDMGISAQGGQVHLNPLSASVYSGTLSGDIQIDAATDSPEVSENLKLNGVQLAGLSQDLAGSDRIAGTLDLDSSTHALGRTVGELRHTVTGRLDFTIKNGSLGGVNVWDAVVRGYADAHHQPAPPPAVPRTAFGELRGSASMSRGVLTNRNFSAYLPNLAVKGVGRLDLVGLALDYSLTGKVLGMPRSAPGIDLGGLRGASVPLKVTGTLFDIDVKPEFGRK